MRLLFFAFLGLLLSAGRELTAQNDVDKSLQSTYKYYSLSGLKMSEDGEWFIVRKSYNGLEPDTLLVFTHLSPEKPLFERSEIRATFFLQNGCLLLQDTRNVEFLNLKNQTSTYFYDIKRVELLDSKKYFVLHYGIEKNKRLELYDCNGFFINALENVVRFRVAENGNIYAVIEKYNKHCDISLLNDVHAETLYTCPHPIEQLDIDPDGRGVMLFTREEKSSHQEIIYLDVNTKKSYPLKDVLPVDFERGGSELISEEGTYFLRLFIEKKNEETPLVDIWYGNDERLDEKLYSPGNYLYYLWEPKNRKIDQIGNKDLPQVINIGNKNAFLCFSFFKMNDYTVYSGPVEFEMFYCRGAENDYRLIDTIGEVSYISPDGEYLLWPLFSNKNYRLKSPESWSLFHIPTGKKHSICNNMFSRAYFSNDGKDILFDGMESVWRYNLEKGELNKLFDFPGSRVIIVNGDNKSITGDPRIHKNSVDTMHPLIIRLENQKENKASYVMYDDGELATLISATSKRITDFRYNEAYNHFCYIEENYNLPPQLVSKQLEKKETILYRSNLQDKAIHSLKQEIISYENSDGKLLNGILYYPLYYDASKQYPLVVHIYEIQRKSANYYPLPVCGSANSDGFDLRLLLEKGYFVYFPDIIYGDRGTGLSALDCVNRSLDAISGNQNIDKNRIGLIGHSHGGYQTNFIATHSDRFAAYVSGAGNSDIIRSYFSFNYNFASPFYWQFENGQYQFGKSFSEDKQLYFQNNPIHYVDKVNAPILLWTGMKDQNIDWQQTMEFYIGLKRYNKKVISLFYPDEGHAIMDNKASKDLCSRIMDWFDYFLKSNEDKEWINKGLKKGLSRK